MLPVDDYREEITSTLSTAGALIFTAPPGSGKSTRLPIFLAEMPAVKGEVVVLQPRRLAARMVANSVAKMHNFTLGQEVGYEVRGEKMRSAKTKISYRTDGLFLRQLVHGNLQGIGAVVLDEFHERSWQTDLVLALLVEKQKELPNLKMVVMSATMEVNSLAKYLQAPIIECQTRTYPIEIFYRHFERTIPLWERAFQIIKNEISSRADSQHILVFMPGVYEINRCVEMCQVFKNYTVFSLHGSMSPDQQDKALRSSDKNKIIITTNIAETSLTVEGVNVVVDCGYAKINRYQLSRGIDALNLEPISQFSAEQRAGRAGRLGPGLCYRLWSREEHGRKELATTPEIFRVDLAEVVLQVIAAGYSPNLFKWYEKPSSSALSEAVNLLNLLGALKNGNLSDIGTAIAEFPAHPRIGRFLIEAEKLGCFFEASLWAAILSEKSPVDNKHRLEDNGQPSSDLAAISHICHQFFSANTSTAEKLIQKYNLKVATLKTIAANFEQFSKLADSPSNNSKNLPLDLAAAILVAYPDKLAVRLDHGSLRYRLTNGKTAELTRSSAVRSSEFIVATEVIELNAGGNYKLLISNAVEIPYDLLEEKFLEQLEFKNELFWNDISRTVDYREIILLNGLTIKEQIIQQVNPGLEAATILANKVLDGSLTLNNWNNLVDRWLEKVRWISEIFPEKKLLTYNDEDIKKIVIQFCLGCRSYKEIKNIDVLAYFKNALSWQEQQFVEAMTPEKILLSNGKNVKVKYESGKAPKISALIQDFFGVEQTPQIAEGRVKVLIEFLAPNHRPVHLTDDLKGFWTGVYKDIRSQLAGRYPKHKWI